MECEPSVGRPSIADFSALPTTHTRDDVFQVVTTTQF